MMNGVLKEKLFKKMFALLAAYLCLLSLMQIGIQMYSINSIFLEQTRLRQQTVGIMAAYLPEKELEVVKAVLNPAEEEKVLAGAKILEKYGYDRVLRIWEDGSFTNTFRRLTIINAIVILTLILLTLANFLHGAAYLIKKLEGLSGCLDNIMDGNYVGSDQNEEGLIGRLNVQLSQLARRLYMGMEILRKDKENIKSLVTDISHQIKTPLASIKLFNTLLSEVDLKGEEAKEFIERSSHEINKLEWLTSSLFKISRLEVGMIKLKQENSPIKETIYEAIDGIFLKAHEKQINVEAGPLTDIVVCHDRKWTKEAILNVLENGVKYTAEGGKIHLSLADLGSYVRIDIIDNGIGIRPEEFNNIFKRFYRGKSDAVTAAEGSGVGLYLTRKILEEQGGSIIVDSHIGNGAKFSLFLQKCK